MRSATFLIVLALAPLADAVAQVHLPLEPGQRVRVTAPECTVYRRLPTTFEMVRNDTLVLGVVSCPLATVTRLEAPVGRQSNWMNGALLGGGFSVAFLASVFVGLCASEFSSSGCSLTDYAEAVFLFAAVGALPGAVIGALIKSDRWEELPLGRPRVSIVPQRHGGLGLGLAVSF
jgi:hypothetical protein